MPSAGVWTLQKLGRMLVAALLVLTVVLPTAAAAGESEKTNVPSEYAAALRVVAEGLGVSYEELTSASKHELQTLLCDKLDKMSTDEIVAKAREALDEVPEEELGDAEREQLMEKLPAIVERLGSRYCDGYDRRKDRDDRRKDRGDDRRDDDDAKKDEDAKDDDAEKDEVDDVKDDDVKDDDVKDDDVKDDDVKDDDIPVPTRVDTGGGGAGGTGMVPAAFGALFAALFGLVGVGITGRRSTG
jgi:hypothetical protein